MSRTIQPGQYAEPFKASDSTLAAKAGPRGVYTLASSTVYYAEINVQTSPCESIHLQSSAALVATVTVETSDLANGEASSVSTTAGDWIQQNPSSAYVPTAGTGVTPTALSIAFAGGGSGGGAQINLSGLASARLRLKIDVTTGGTLRIAHSGKASS